MTNFIVKIRCFFDVVVSFYFIFEYINRPIYISGYTNVNINNKYIHQMEYPIFNSIRNQIERELTRKDLTLKKFKTWHEDRINATGLEITIDVSNQNSIVREISINFDWDRFRESYLAQHLNGLAEHPLLQEENLKSVTAFPKIDVELSWIFDDQKTYLYSANPEETKQMPHTQNWMQALSKKVTSLLAEEECITRWHLEMEGDMDPSQLSRIMLISYFRYSLQDLKSLNDVLSTVKYSVRTLMIKSNKVCQLSDDTLKDVA